MTTKQSKKDQENKAAEVETQKEKEHCFAIMPISDPDGYATGHFQRVYEDIITPACEIAGYEAVRADEVKAANFIQIDILKKLLEAPVAICDLSSRNPNVLFELGIRQAFDMPVVLIQEKGTPRIFDITGLRIIDYPRDLNYRGVLDVQEQIAQTLTCFNNHDKRDDHTNSIIRLLSTRAASVKPLSEQDRKEVMIESLFAEIKGVKELVMKNYNPIKSSSADFLRNTLAHCDDIEIPAFENFSERRASISQIEMKLRRLGRNMDRYHKEEVGEAHQIELHYLIKKDLAFLKANRQEMLKRQKEELDMLEKKLPF